MTTQLSALLSPTAASASARYRVIISISFVKFRSKILKILKNIAICRALVAQQRTSSTIDYFGFTSCRQHDMIAELWRPDERTYQAARRYSVTSD